MWVRDEDILAHPKDLNFYGGLLYDDRLEREGGSGQKVPLAPPFLNLLSMQAGEASKSLNGAS